MSSASYTSQISAFSACHRTCIEASHPRRCIHDWLWFTAKQSDLMTDRGSSSTSACTNNYMLTLRKHDCFRCEKRTQALRVSCGGKGVEGPSVEAVSHGRIPHIRKHKTHHPTRILPKKQQKNPSTNLQYSLQDEAQGQLNRQRRAPQIRHEETSKTRCPPPPPHILLYPNPKKPPKTNIQTLQKSPPQKPSNPSPPTSSPRPSSTPTNRPTRTQPHTSTPRSGPSSPLTSCVPCARKSSKTCTSR